MLRDTKVIFLSHYLDFLVAVYLYMGGFGFELSVLWTLNYFREKEANKDISTLTNEFEAELVVRLIMVKNSSLWIRFGSIIPNAKPNSNSENYVLINKKFTEVNFKIFTYNNNRLLINSPNLFI